VFVKWAPAGSGLDLAAEAARMLKTAKQKRVWPGRPAGAGYSDRVTQTKALRPVMARPTTRVLISRVPS
jgi:hypothetical protein